MKFCLFLVNDITSPLKISSFSKKLLSLSKPISLIQKLKSNSLLKKLKFDFIPLINKFCVFEEFSRINSNFSKFIFVEKFEKNIFILSIIEEKLLSPIFNSFFKYLFIFSSSYILFDNSISSSVNSSFLSSSFLPKKKLNDLAKKLPFLFSSTFFSTVSFVFINIFLISGNNIFSSF